VIQAFLPDLYSRQQEQARMPVSPINKKIPAEIEAQGSVISLEIMRSGGRDGLDE
jgi:hypothetical protein